MIQPLLSEDREQKNKDLCVLTWGVTSQPHRDCRGQHGYKQSKTTHFSRKTGVQVGETALPEESDEGSLPLSPVREWWASNCECGGCCNSWDQLWCA